MGKAAVYRAVKLFLDVSYAFVQILLICWPDLETESRAAV